MVSQDTTRKKLRGYPGVGENAIRIVITSYSLHYTKLYDGDVHEHLVEAIYADAARIADRAVTRPGRNARPTFDRTLDRILTSRVWGFPIMLLLFALMFWLTVVGSYNFV